MTEASSPIRTIGICGGGKMGNSFFDHLSEYCFNVIFYQRNPLKVRQSQCKWERRIERMQKSGQGGNTPVTITFTTELNELTRADLIVEMIPEDLQLKQQMINTLATINTRAVIASSSSAITPSRLTDSKAILKRLVGLHFFYPVPFTEYAEVIINPLISDENLKRVEFFLETINKRGLKFSEDAGSVLNKLVLYYHNETLLMAFTENISVALIDDVVEDSLFTIGPFRYMDMVGLDTIFHSRSEYIRGDLFYDSFSITQQKLKSMIADGYLGKKTNKGFYAYPSGRLTHYFESADTTADRKTILERLQMVFVNTGLRFLELNYLNRKQLKEVSIELLQAFHDPLKILSETGVDQYIHNVTRYYSKYGRYYRPVSTISKININS